MGYRSEVAITVDEKHAKKFKEVLGDLCKYATGEWPGGIHFEDIKWYPFDPEIKKVMDFLETLDDEDFGFIELGEDVAHCDIKGQPYDYDLCICRSINVPEKGEKA